MSVITRESQDFIDKWAVLFADNEFEHITERTYRDFTADVAALRDQGQYRQVLLTGAGNSAGALLAREGVEPGLLYALKGTPDPADPAGLAGTWNGAGVEQTVYLLGLGPRLFASLGCLLDTRNNVTTPVQVDVRAGTHQALAAGYTDAQLDALLASKQDAAPVMGVVNGVEMPFATLAGAISGGANILYLRADLEIDKATPTFSGSLYGNGHTIMLNSGGRLRLLRYAKLFDCLIDAQANAYVDVIGSGTPGTGGAVPPVEECLEVRDSGLAAPLRFAAATAYQGLVLRGNSYAANLVSGGGPVYLYDLAYVGVNTPPGFVVYDKRPDTVEVGTGAVLRFDKSYEYPALSSGTFTVDTTAARVGATVRVRLEATASAPTLPTSGFTRYGGQHVANKANLYAFCVAANGTVDYYIVQPA